MTGASVALAVRIGDPARVSAAMRVGPGRLDASCWNRWGFVGACCRLSARRRVLCGNSHRKKP